MNLRDKIITEIFWNGQSNNDVVSVRIKVGLLINSDQLFAYFLYHIFCFVIRRCKALVAYKLMDPPIHMLIHVLACFSESPVITVMMKTYLALVCLFVRDTGRRFLYSCYLVQVYAWIICYYCDDEDLPRTGLSLCSGHRTQVSL